jgi:hypothetical protein
VAPRPDRSGDEVTATDDRTVERYDEAVDSLLRFGDDVMDRWEATVADEPDFAMGHVGRSYLRSISSERPFAVEAGEVLDDIDSDRLTDRERRHVSAARAYAGGDLTGASELLALFSIHHPMDALALSFGHQLDFWSGDAMNLRERVAGG